MREQELIIYRDLGSEGKLLRDMTWLIKHYGETSVRGQVKVLLHTCIHDLLKMAENHGFYGNLWHCYLAHLLVNNENSYSKACEITGEIKGTINRAVLHDIMIFKEWFDYDFRTMKEELQADILALILDYQNSGGENKIYSSHIRERICSLAVQLKEQQTAEEMKDVLTSFYQEYGVGKYGLHQAFRIIRDEQGVQIVPIINITPVYLNDLVGYEIPKRKLIDNTEAFVKGRRANNCLLYGDAGTGKSSGIKGIANEYYGRGLRMIEIYKHQFRDLLEVAAQIKNRNYKFIIYMDDLSFEDFEVEYKYLKAVIEGGLEGKPSNVLIYATSNRRHLVREKFSDKEECRDDLHKRDTVQEKLSLAARFGETIYFGAPDRSEFHNIVKVLAERYHIHMKEEEMLREANRWEMYHGGLSGRTAQQFIDYLLGRE